MRTSWKVAVVAAGALLAVAGVAAGAGAATPGNRPPTPVEEQNVDAGGAIRVAQQGVVDAAVTNLPTDPDGNLRTADAGSQALLDAVRTSLERLTVSADGLEVDVTDPISVLGTVGIDPAANLVSLDPAVQARLDDIDATLDQLTFDADGKLLVSGPASGGSDLSTRNPWGFSAPTPLADGVHMFGTGSEVELTGASVVTDRPARLLFTRDPGAVGTVHAVFLQAGVPLNMTFPHPLLVSGAQLVCDSTCTAAWGFTAR